MPGAVSFGEVIVRFGADVSNFSMGTAAVIAGLAGVAIAVGDSVKKAGDLQEQITRLSTSAGEFANNLPMISAGILKMSVDTGTSTAQLAQGMYYIESAGNHGAAALAVLGVAARGARSENADLDTVAKALTTTMTDYHMPVDQAAMAMNGLIVTVQNGKTNLQELARALGTVAPIASALHIPFAQVAGAMDTMTNAGMTARQASMNLAHVLIALEAPSGIAVGAMKTVGLSAQEVRDALVHKGLPEALQMIEDHVGKKFPADSVEYQQALKNILGGIVGLKLAAMLTGDSLKLTQDHIKLISAALKEGSSAVLGWDLVQGNFNFQLSQARMAVDALQIGIGTMLLPVLGQVLARIMPLISGFAAWTVSGHAVSDMLAYFHKNAQVLIPVLAGVGAIIAAVLIPAVWSLAAGVIAATWPFLALGAAVAGLTAIFMHFYQTNAGFKAFADSVGVSLQRLWTVISTGIGPALTALGNFMTNTVVPAFAVFGNFMTTVVLPILQRVGAFLVETFKPVWDQLVHTIDVELRPAWVSLVAAIKPVLPQLQQFGQFLLGAVAVALTIVIALIGGLIHGLASALSGIISIIGGVVSVLSGAVKIIAGIISFIVDLATGKFNKLGGDLGLIMDGIGTMFHGVWEIIKGIFQTVIGAIVGFCAGFVQTLVGIFQALSDTLVGHSIIPDMVNSILGYFTLMGTTLHNIMVGIQTTISVVWNTIVSTVTGLVTTLWNTIQQKAGQMRDTFLGAFNAIAGGIGSIVRAIANNAIGQLRGMLTSLQDFLNFFADAINNVAHAVGAGNVVGHVSIPMPPFLAQGTSNFEGGPAIVGEQGRELVMLPRGTSVLPNDQTEQLLKSGLLNGIIPGFAGGTGNAIGDLVGWFTGGAGNVLSHVFTASLHFSGAMEQVASSVSSMIGKWGLDKIGSLMSKYIADLAAAAAKAAASGLSAFSGAGSPGNVAAWITSAIGLTGVPMSWLSALETIAMAESGGNPNAINLTDSNAAAGHPSQGLMQTIPGTFAANAVAGHTNILNPVDNAAAAINYIKGRYGTVFNVPGIVSMASGGAYVGYGNGGIISEQITGIGQSGQVYRFGESGRERVTPIGADERSVVVNLNVDGRTLAQALGPFMANEMRINLGVRR